MRTYSENLLNISTVHSKIIGLQGTDKNKESNAGTCYIALIALIALVVLVMIHEYAHCETPVSTLTHNRV